MKTALIKLVLSVSIGSMIALAVLGVYYVAVQSQDPGIVAPAPDSFTQLPSQAPPRPKASKPFIRPGFYNEDAPSPK